MSHQLPVGVTLGGNIRSQNKKHFNFLAGPESLYAGPDSPNKPRVLVNSPLCSQHSHNSSRTAVNFPTSASRAATVAIEFVARMSPHMDHELEASLVMSR